MSWADERAGEDALREREYERRERAKSATVPRAVADRLADKVAEALQGIPPAAGTLRLALDEYRKAVGT